MVKTKQVFTLILLSVFSAKSSPIMFPLELSLFETVFAERIKWKLLLGQHKNLFCSEHMPVSLFYDASQFILLAMYLTLDLQKIRILATL